MNSASTFRPEICRRFHLRAAACGVALVFLAGPLRAADKIEPVATDVSYGPNPHQILDIYLPPDAKSPCPVLIWYGGIWQPSKHAVDVNRFFPSHVAVVAVETRTL